MFENLMCWEGGLRNDLSVNLWGPFLIFFILFGFGGRLIFVLLMGLGVLSMELKLYLLRSKFDWLALGCLKWPFFFYVREFSRFI